MARTVRGRRRPGAPRGRSAFGGVADACSTQLAPDLLPIDLAWIPHDPPSDLQHDIEVVIANQGGRAAGPCSARLDLVHNPCTPAAVRVRSWRLSLAAGLAPGASVTHRVRVDFDAVLGSSASGSYGLAIVVDDRHQVREGPQRRPAEANNRYDGCHDLYDALGRLVLAAGETMRTVVRPGNGGVVQPLADG